MLQVYKRMFQGMFAAKAIEAGASGEMLSNPNSDIEGILNDFDKNGDRLIKINELTGIRNEDLTFLMDDLGFTSARLREGVQLGEIANKIRETRGQAAQSIKATSREAQSATATELSGDNNPYAGVDVEIFDNETMKGVSQIDQIPHTDTTYSASSDINNVMFGVSKERLTKKANAASLGSILRSMSPSELKNFFYHEVPVDHRNEKDAFKEALRSKGYDSTGLQFGKNEREVIYKTLEYYDKMNSAPRDQQISALLDFNGDMKIDTQLVNWAGEAQMRELIANTPNGFNNLLSNLGLNGLNLDNFFVAREKFQSALSNAVASGIKPGALVQADGVARFVDAQLERQQGAAKEIGAEVENLLLSDDRLSYLPEADRRRAIDAVKLEAIGMVIGNRSAVGASFDVRGATKDLIHSATVGVMQDGHGNLVPGIALSRKVLDAKIAGRNVRVDAGAGAALDGSIKFVPFVNIAGEIIKPDIEMDSLFDKDVKGKVAVSGFVNISAKLSAGLVVSKASERTSMGINEMVRQMDSRLGQVLLDIKSGQGFDAANYEGKTEADRATYEQIKGLFDRGARRLTESEKIVYLASIKNGYMENYASELYENAQGYKITGVGLSYLAGCFPIPSIHGEKIKHKWVENNDDVGTSAEHAISSRESSLNAIGGSMTTFEGKKVIYISGVSEIFADESIQVVKDSNGVYISGDLRGKCLKLNTHEGTTGRNKVLHITQTTYQESTELVFEGNPTEGISSDVMLDANEIKTRIDYKSTLDAEGRATGKWIQTQAPQEGVRGGFESTGYLGLSESVPENYKDVVKAIDSIVTVAWIGNESKTLMAEFQSMFYAKQNVSSEVSMSDMNVEDSWTFLVNNMLGNGIPGRSPSSWGEQILPNELKAHGVLDTIRSASTREEKMVVMEAIMNALRNDNSTAGGTIIDGQTLRGFSTRTTDRSPNSRADVFSGVLANALGIRKELLSQAQQDFYNKQIVVNGKLVTVGDQNSFDTAYKYAPAATMTAASQLNKNGIRGGIKLSRVQEYVVDENGTIIETPINGLSTDEVNHRIREMDNDDVAKRAQAVSSYLGTTVSADMIRDALINNRGIIQSADGSRQVVLSYSMSFALTGNCFNDHVIERIGMETQVLSAGAVAIQEKGYYVQEGTKLQVIETTTSGTNTAIYGSTAAAVGVNFDGGGQDSERGTEPGEETDRSTTADEGGSTDGNTTDGGSGVLGGPEPEEPGVISNPPADVEKKGSILSGLGFGKGALRADRKKK